MEEEQRRLTRKGSAGRAVDGSLVLVNENDQAFKVNEAIVMVWQMCDGKTLEELFEEVSMATGIDIEDLKEPITDIVAKLKQVNLVE